MSDWHNYEGISHTATAIWKQHWKKVMVYSFENSTERRWWYIHLKTALKEGDDIFILEHEMFLLHWHGVSISGIALHLLRSQENLTMLCYCLGSHVWNSNVLMRVCLFFCWLRSHQLSSSTCCVTRSSAGWLVKESTDLLLYYFFNQLNIIYILYPLVWSVPCRYISMCMGTRDQNILFVFVYMTLIQIAIYISAVNVFFKS